MKCIYPVLTAIILFIAAGCSPSSPAGVSSGVCVAAGDGDLEAVRKAVNAGYSLNTPDQSGTLPLFWAATGGHTEVIKFLLDKKADVHAINGNNGQTALIRAASFGNIEAVRLLLEKGADINARDRDGATALMEAAAYGHLETVRLLIRKGADVNAKDSSGTTVLMSAVEGRTGLENAKRMVCLLIDNKADIHSKNKHSGLTALAIAREIKGYAEIVKLLKKNAVEN